MKTSRALLAVAALLTFSVGACARVPTGAAEADTASPAYDGGHTFGSGNREGENATTAADPSGTTTASTDSTTQRGGHTFGSGN